MPRFASRQARTLDPDDVIAAQMRPVADRHAVGNDIADNGRHAAQKRVMADAHELMHRRHARDDDVVADFAMAAERRVVGEGDIVADDAVMGDMRIGHEHAIVADRRRAVPGIAAGMHGGRFADDAVPADGIIPP